MKYTKYYEDSTYPEKTPSRQTHMNMTEGIIITSTEVTSGHQTQQGLCEFECTYPPKGKESAK